MPLLRGVGINFVDMDRGMNGYTNSWQIQNNGKCCGHIAVDKNDVMGGQFELTGEGCQMVQLRWDLWCYLVAGLNQFGFKIKRVDIAGDCKGDVWDKFGLNMVGIAKMVDDGLFANTSARGGAKAKVSVIGDWLKLLVGGVSSDDYDPKKQCLDGLTLNVGSSSSRSMWCIYEKGKERAGKNPDLYADGYMGSWVRFERRLTSGSGRSEWLIDYDFLVMPDEAFFYQCDGVKGLFSEWCGFQRSEGVEVGVVSISGIDLQRVGLDKCTNLKRAALHVARQSARFFKTLEMIGVDVVDFVNVVKHEEGIKGFNPDIYSEYSVVAGEDVMDFLRSRYV